MIQGTGSHVGKSLIVAGLCRAFADRGLKVAPFKPQNMSNNAGVTADGGEIGRAQMLQARAARVAPSVHMNPVLLKPETETGAQVIVQGKRWATLKAREYGERKSELLPPVLESFADSEATSDLVLVEGAGSPAEINLRRGDIANMGFATAADVPVVARRRHRPGRRDRGAGRHARAAGAGRADARKSASSSTASAAILRFSMRDSPRSRGAPAGRRSASCRILPTRRGCRRRMCSAFRPTAPKPGARIRIAVPRLPRIANFDDLDPLRAEPDVDVLIVEPGKRFQAIAT